MKNKLKLIIIIFFLSLIVSGCELNYNLTIKDDRSIYEEIVVTEKNSILEKKYDDYKEEIKEKELFYNDHDLYSSYESRKIFKSDYSGLKLYKDYPYGQFRYSPTYASFFQNYSFTEGKDGYILRLLYPVKENIYPDTNNSDEKIDKAYINIKSYLKVIDSNCDKYDEKTKTYTWEIDDDFFNNDQKGLYIKLSKEKDYQVIFMDFFREHSTAIITISIILVVLLTIAMYIYKKYRNGMKV